MRNGIEGVCERRHEALESLGWKSYWPFAEATPVVLRYSAIPVRSCYTDGSTTW